MLRVDIGRVLCRNGIVGATRFLTYDRCPAGLPETLTVVHIRAILWTLLESSCSIHESPPVRSGR